MSEASNSLFALTAATHDLHLLTKMVDEGTSLSDAFTKLFQETKLDQAEAVDRRILFSHLLEGMISAAQETKKLWQDRLATLQGMQERLEQQTKQLLIEYPNLPYKGKEGRLALQRSPTTVEITEAIDLDEIDQRFVRVKKELNKVVIKAVLESGEFIPWARLKEDTHLRIKT